MCGAGSRSTVATTRATSSTATGEVRPVPNGSASVPFSRIDGTASVVNSGLSRDTDRPLGTQCAQLARACTIVSEHAARGHVPRTPLLEDFAPDAASAGDKYKV